MKIRNKKTGKVKVIVRSRTLKKRLKQIKHKTYKV